MSGDDHFQSWAAEEIILLRSSIHLRRPSEYPSLSKYVSLNSEVSWAYLHKPLYNIEPIGAASTSLNDPFELILVIFSQVLLQNRLSIWTTSRFCLIVRHYH
jgi:hypothetical protein